MATYKVTDEQLLKFALDAVSTAAFFSGMDEEEVGPLLDKAAGYFRIVVEQQDFEEEKED